MSKKQSVTGPVTLWGFIREFFLGPRPKYRVYDYVKIFADMEIAWQRANEWFTRTEKFYELHDALLRLERQYRFMHPGPPKEELRLRIEKLTDRLLKECK